MTGTERALREEHEWLAKWCDVFATHFENRAAALGNRNWPEGENAAGYAENLRAIAKILRAALARAAAPDEMAEFDKAEFNELLREVVALREWKAAHEAAAFAAPVAASPAVPSAAESLKPEVPDAFDPAPAARPKGP